MTTLDIAELRRLAEAATEGLWFWWGNGLRATNARYLAAANPAAVLALLDERDALAAKVERVRDWIDHRGVNVDDRDDDYMTGYRDAQRHALQDARGLLAILDGTDS